MTFGEGRGTEAAVGAFLFFGGDGVGETKNTHVDKAESEEAGEGVVEIIEAIVS